MVLRWLVEKFRPKRQHTNDAGKTKKEELSRELRKVLNGVIDNNEDDCSTGVSLKVVVGTYNVGEKLPDSETRNEVLEWLTGSNPEEDPDIIALGLQEVDMSPASVLLETLSPKGVVWAQFIESFLGFGCDDPPYTAAQPVAVAGLLLLIFVKNRPELRHTTRDITHTIVRTGIQGLANKGGVAVRIQLCGRNFVFINSHFEAHENRKEVRDANYASILRGLSFPPMKDSVDVVSSSTYVETESLRLCNKHSTSQLSDIESCDYAFWFGDLNYRLQGNSMNTQSIRARLQRKQTQELLRYDELSHATACDQAFAGWKEMDINFPPTYKFIEGTNTYNTKRTPAWTDRILYWTGKRGRVSTKSTSTPLTVTVLPPRTHLDPNEFGIDNSPQTQTSYFSCSNDELAAAAVSVRKQKNSFGIGPIPVDNIGVSAPSSQTPSRRVSVTSIVNTPPHTPHTPVDEDHFLFSHLVPIEGSYRSYQVMLSDHRPVSAAFRVKGIIYNPTAASDAISSNARANQIVDIIKKTGG